MRERERWRDEMQFSMTMKRRREDREEKGGVSE